MAATRSIHFWGRTQSLLDEARKYRAVDERGKSYTVNSFVNEALIAFLPGFIQQQEQQVQKNRDRLLNKPPTTPTHVKPATRSSRRKRTSNVR